MLSLVKKHLLLPFFILVVLTTSAQAFAPVVWVAYVVGAELAPALTASLFLHAGAGAAYMAYQMKPQSSTSHQTDTVRPIIRESEVTWVDLTEPTPTDPVPQPQVKKANIQATVKYDDFMAMLGTNATAANKALYPKLHAAAISNGASPVSKNSVINEVVSVPTLTGFYKVTQQLSVAPSCRGSSDVAYFMSLGTYADAGRYTKYYTEGSCPGGSNLGWEDVRYVSTAAPPPQDKTAAKLAEALGALPGSTGLTTPQYTNDQGTKDEIDKLLKDQPNIIHYEDGKGVPLVPPPQALTKTAADTAARNYNTYITVKNTATTAAAAAATAATVAANAEARAQEAANAASAAGGTDPALNAAAAAARAAADAAAIAAGQAAVASGRASGDAAAADQAAAGEDEEEPTPPVNPSDNTYDASIPGTPDKKNIGGLLQGFLQSSPLVSMVQSFAVTTSDSVSVLYIGNIYGQELSFDFSRWESLLRTCGGVLIIIMHGYCVLIVVRGW